MQGVVCRGSEPVHGTLVPTSYQGYRARLTVYAGVSQGTGLSQVEVSKAARQGLQPATDAAEEHHRGGLAATEDLWL